MSYSILIHAFLVPQPSSNENTEEYQTKGDFCRTPSIQQQLESAPSDLFHQLCIPITEVWINPNFDTLERHIRYCQSLMKVKLYQIYCSSLSHKTCPTVCWKEIKLVHISVSDTTHFYNTVCSIRLTVICLALINCSQEFHWDTKMFGLQCKYERLQLFFATTYLP